MAMGSLTELSHIGRILSTSACTGPWLPWGISVKRTMSLPAGILPEKSLFFILILKKVLQFVVINPIL